MLAGPFLFNRMIIQVLEILAKVSATPQWNHWITLMSLSEHLIAGGSAKQSAFNSVVEYGPHKARVVSSNLTRRTKLVA